MTVTLADKLSIVPGVQQVVGAITIASSLLKIIYDLAKIIFNGINSGIISPLFYNEADQRSASQSFLKSKIDFFDNLVDQNGPDIKVGLLRSIPIVGSIYSAIVCYRGTHENVTPA